MARNPERQTKTRINNHLHRTKENKGHKQMLSTHQPLISHLQPSPWKMQRWPNDLPRKPRQRSTSARMKKRQMIRKQHGHSAPSCLPSLRRGYHTTSWCWSTLSVKTVYQKPSGHWVIGCAMSTAQWTPCATRCATRPSGQLSGIFWCASGSKRRTSPIFIRGRLWLSRKKSQCKATNCMDLCFKNIFWSVFRVGMQSSNLKCQGKDPELNLLTSFAKLCEGPKAGLFIHPWHPDSYWPNILWLIMVPEHNSY